MALVFAAVVPHPPLLAPGLDPAAAKSLNKTRQAYDRLAEALYSSKPTVLIVITPHGQVIANAWQLYQNDSFVGNLQHLSDFTTKITLAGAVGFSHQLKEYAEDHGFAVLLQSNQPLDYGSVLPLVMLTKNLPQIRIAPLLISDNNVAAHYEFGKLLREVVFSSRERVAVIASANLSHCLSPDGPGGYRPESAEFDSSVRKCLRNGNSEILLAIPTALAQESMTCGWRSISILLGTLHLRHYAFQELAYEYPQGIGYLTAYTDLL